MKFRVATLSATSHPAALIPRRPMRLPRRFTEPRTPSLSNDVPSSLIMFDVTCTVRWVQMKESLTRLSDAATGFKPLDVYIGEKDYQSLRLAMRKPPIVYLRSSARKTIASIEDEVEAQKVSCLRGGFE